MFIRNNVYHRLCRIHPSAETMCPPPIPPFCAVDYINCIYFADIAMLYNISEKKTLHFVGL